MRWIPFALVLLLATPPAAAADPVLAALETELARASSALGGLDPAPYLLALQAIETSRLTILGEEGGLQGTAPQTTRWIHADVRLGTPALDSTHPLRDLAWDDTAPPGRELGVGDDPGVLGLAIAEEIDSRYRLARERWERVQADQRILVTEEDRGPDLADAPAPVALGPGVGLESIDRSAWEAAARRASAVFADSPALDPSVSLSAEAETRWFVSSAGARQRQGTLLVRAAVTADVVAADGARLQLTEAFDAADPAVLPDAAELEAAARRLLDKLVALAAAPLQEPYQGPAILSGRASAVFFHEIFGHRVEGQRLKQVDDAQTFLSRIGESILPRWLSVVDDPSQRSLGGVDLRGHYRFDDEGVPAQAVHLVRDGVFDAFLESRSSVTGAANGHGRRQIGNMVFARQGNLMVQAAQAVPEAQLRRQLIDAARQAGQPFGLIIDDIDGGFTFTGRDIPNAFQIDVVLARRVWVDGRPDELVRGIDLIGTPLQTFARIVAASDRVEVFNGTCGAESGWVPVSASAPSLLVSMVETQKKLSGQDRPPQLGPPTIRQGDLLAVLESEVARAVDELSLAGAEDPAWALAAVRDEQEFGLVADFGAVRREWGAPGRPARVEVVVGDEQVNSSRIVGSLATLPDSVQRPRLVVDDVPAALSRDLWLSADEGYKSALQRIAFKRAALARLGDERPPDLTPAQALRVVEPAPIAVDRARLRELALAASGALRGRGLVVGRATANSNQGNDTIVDSRGMVVVQSDGYAALQVRGELLRADGLRLVDERSWVGRRAADLPSVDEVTAAAAAMARTLVARSTAEAVLDYEGPVVLEGEAAADLFRYLLPSQLRGTPPEPDDARPYRQTLKDGPRIGRRVLPEAWSVRDDPNAGGAGAAGGYAIDREGVRAQAVQLVDDGRVVDLVMSRVPRPGRSGSNGHARGGIQQEWTARLSHWSVQPRRLLGDRAFDRAVGALRRASGLERVLVVRRFAAGWEGELPAVADASWRYPDGREEAVLALELGDVDRRLLRDVVAVGGGLQTLRYLAPHHPWGRAGAVQGLPMSVRAPGRVLLEEIEASYPGPAEEPPLFPPTTQ